MYYQAPAGLPASGQDPGSATAMQMIMAWIGQQKAQEAKPYTYEPDPQNPSTFGGALNPQTGQYGSTFGGALDPQTGRYGSTFGGALDPQTGRYSGYDTSIYGPLGVKSTTEY